MKKIIISCLLLIIIITGIIFITKNNKPKDNTNLKKVKVAEPTLT